MIPQHREESTTREPLKTLVLLCASLENMGSGLDLEQIRKWLQDMDPAIEVQAVPELCHWPGKIAEVVPASKSLRLVLGLCSHDYSEIELYAHARKVGLDPFGLELVNLGGYCAHVHLRSGATDKAKLLLGAAVARVRAFAGSEPDNVKPVLSWNQTVSRRGLFTLPPVHYEAVPSIQSEACAAQEACRVCANICPQEALSPSVDGRMVLDKTRCTGCGSCLPVCPKTAIDLPGVSPEQIHVQIAALLNTAPPAIHPRAILFVCEKSLPLLEPLAQKGIFYRAGWLPVEVPCVGMIPATWLLHCLNLGAAAVGALPCGRRDCCLGEMEVIKGRVDYSREFLALLGRSPERIRLFDPSDEPGLIRSLTRLPGEGGRDGRGHPQDASCFTFRGTGGVLLGLAEQCGAPLDRFLDHPYSPLGDVELMDGCTACGACTGSCPTGSLTLERDGHDVALTFDAHLCVGCGECVAVCPEKLLLAKRTTDLRRLSQGRFVLHRDSEVLCEKCGGPIAPGEMLKKITNLLRSDPTVSAISRYCLACRGVVLRGQSTREENLN